MSYTDPVKFTATGQYGCGAEDEDDVYTVEEFRRYCKDGVLVDYDGFGEPVRDGKADPGIWISPADLEAIPEDATHIVWYNR